MRRLLLPYTAVAIAFLVATPAFASAPADSLAGVSISCVDARSGSSLELRAQRLDSLGAIVADWSGDAARLCVGSMQDVATSAVSDGEGGAFVVWTDVRTGDADLWIQHLAPDGAPSAGWPEGGRPLATASGAQLAPSLCTDAAGGAIVAWQDYQSSATADIRAQRVSGGGTDLWESGGLLVCAEPHDQTVPAVVADGSGGAFVFWQDSRDGDSDIRAAHVQASGAVAVADQCAACGFGSQRNPSALADASGGAWLVWEVANGADVDVHVTRLDGGLAPLAGFEPSGVLVAGGPGIQFLPAATMGAEHSFIVAWCDRSRDAGDVRVQRVMASGALAWPDSSALACEPPGEQYAPAVASDGAGGALVVWEQSHHGRSDIRASRMDASGARLWGPSGQPVCVGPGDQFAPSVTGDGFGGAFVVWTDAAAPARGAILSARPVATQGLPEFLDLTVTPKRAHLRWRLGSAPYSKFTIERRESPAEWAEAAVLRADVDSLLDYEESGLSAGAVIEYRLALATPEGPLYLPVQTARIPAPPPFALRLARYVPSGDALQLHFTLPTEAPVSVEVLDVAGRRVRRLPLTVAEAGEHDIRVPGLGLASGWYFVRLHQGRDVRGSRLVVVR